MKLCNYLGHQRSRPLAQKDSVNGWHSRCRFCNRPMLREPRTGAWRLRESHEELASTLGA